MGYFLDAFRAMATTLGNVFRKPVTVQFPEVIRPRTERLRVSFALPDDEFGEIACVGCLACERICPSQVIKMKATGKKESPVTGKKRQYVDEFTLDLSACIQCELCIQVCNSDAITMVKEAEIPGFNREDLVLHIDKLRGNAKSKTASWGKGTVLQAQQESKPKAEKKPAVEGAAAAEKKSSGETPEKKPVGDPTEKKPPVAEPEKKPALQEPEKKPAVDTPEKKPAVESADKKSVDGGDAGATAATTVKADGASPIAPSESGVATASAATPAAEVAAQKETA